VKAAAVTQVAMTRSAAAPRPLERIAFDRPFGVVVLDAEGEVPLFAGWHAGVQGPEAVGQEAPAGSASGF